MHPNKKDALISHCAEIKLNCQLDSFCFSMLLKHQVLLIFWPDVRKYVFDLIYTLKLQNTGDGSLT